MSIKNLEEERLKKWFWEKYDWECYLKAEAEYFKTHKRRWFWNIPEEDRLWLIKRTEELIQELWNKEVLLEEINQNGGKNEPNRRT